MKGIGGFFYVEIADEVLECRPRGIFKYEKRRITPIVGDYVQVEKTNRGQGVITNITPRNSELIRPSIANVDQAVIVASFRSPILRQSYLDRFLAYGEYHNLHLVVCLTKLDLVKNNNELASIQELYRDTGYPIIATSIYEDVGIGELKELLCKHVSVFAGESGVGKSSLLRKLVVNDSIAIGSISSRLDKGKHTTRAVELLALDCEGKVADTPGFSRLSLKEIPPTKLARCFPELRKYSDECYYRDCLHTNEPNCAIKEAVQDGFIHPKRYDSYVLLLMEVKSEREGNNRW